MERICRGNINDEDYNNLLLSYCRKCKYGKQKKKNVNLDCDLTKLNIDCYYIPPTEFKQLDPDMVLE